jgi:hypothetical protein
MDARCPPEFFRWNKRQWRISNIEAAGGIRRPSHESALLKSESPDILQRNASMPANATMPEAALSMHRLVDLCRCMQHRHQPAIIC